MKHSQADAPALPKPPWIRVRLRSRPEGAFEATRELMRRQRLHTVCEEAACPNIAECWSRGHATVMILGDVCTRACAFCNVATGRPEGVDADEPRHLAEAVAELGLRHVLATDDVAALCLVPGVGKKTAARLLVELKSRLEVPDADPAATAVAAAGGASASARGDVRDALSGLGYGADEIARVLADLPEDGDSSDLLRNALQRLAAA